MLFHKIPHTDLNVSKICLGTMTYGEQNTEAEAHEQLDYALSTGINFIDTAEMYPVPPKPETQGRTEAYIGTWLNKRGKRDDLVIASKVAGPSSRGVDHIRPDMRFTKESIHAAIDTSLARLQTDYIDVYQLHWPGRDANFFSKLNYEYGQDLHDVPMEETLSALGDLVKAGKIRYVGLSNETPWGVMKFLHLADKLGLPRVATIQNPYSLLNRSFEVGLAEVAHREGVELLAYSPLAFGVLSGKYRHGARPEGARLSLYSRFQRYFTEQGELAAEAYCALAEKHGLTPTQMALAYVNTREFVASNIIGATTMVQLKENIESVNITLDEAVLAEIEAISTRYPNPCP
ncbi:NADP(H)-dependent aldo-keto reductase [Pokkaliibacter sp. CJK22405]|uniref:NADP(H)-dependent aldo-keto reductase n=1 Tax=Pokkaliibacter sp. CJK22405 TaxID=3384615 RepID=UPI0039853E69